MANDDVIITRIAGHREAAGAEVDYLPFGTKILKLRVQRNPVTRPDMGPIWLRPRGYVAPDHASEDAADARAFARIGPAGDLWVAWGAGDEQGFSVRYAEGVQRVDGVPMPGSVPQPFDDDEAHFLYFHVIHRPEAADAALPDRVPLTIEAVDASDEVHGVLAVTLTAPEGAADAVRAVWATRWGEDGEAESTIALAAPSADLGDWRVARYVSRWWPPDRVDYAPARPGAGEASPGPDFAAFLEGLQIVFRRRAGAKAEIEVRHAATTLATLDGDIAIPLHDCRLLHVEPMLFTDDRHLVLRLWLYWLHLDFGVDDLLRHVPQDRKEAWRPEAERVRDSLRGFLGLLGWRRNQEIPDIERFDLLVDVASGRVDLVGSDAHWRELWARIVPAPGGARPAAELKILTPNELIAVVLNNKDLTSVEGPPAYDPLANGLCDVANRDHPGNCPHRPAGRMFAVDEQVDEVEYTPCEGCGSRFREVPQPARAPGILGKHAPIFENAVVVRGAVSTNVLEG